MSTPALSGSIFSRFVSTLLDGRSSIINDMLYHLLLKALMPRSSHLKYIVLHSNGYFGFSTATK